MAESDQDGIAGPSAEKLRETFVYDRPTGTLRWKGAAESTLQQQDDLEAPEPQFAGKIAEAAPTNFRGFFR